MSEETSKAIAVSAVCLVFIVSIVCIALVPMPGSRNQKADDRIERLEKQVAEIHNVIVGSKQ